MILRPTLGHHYALTCPSLHPKVRAISTHNADYKLEMISSIIYAVNDFEYIFVDEDYNFPNLWWDLT